MADHVGILADMAVLLNPAPAANDIAEASDRLQEFLKDSNSIFTLIEIVAQSPRHDIKQMALVMVRHFLAKYQNLTEEEFQELPDFEGLIEA
jgi:hypothetical protein